MAMNREHAIAMINITQQLEKQDQQPNLDAQQFVLHTPPPDCMKRSQYSHPARSLDKQPRPTGTSTDRSAPASLTWSPRASVLSSSEHAHIPAPKLASDGFEQSRNYAPTRWLGSQWCPTPHPAPSNILATASMTRRVASAPYKCTRDLE